MIGSEKESMKGIADELEEYKQISDKRSCLEAERERNNKIVAQEAQNHLKEKGRLEKQIEGIKAVIC